jgi:hypothetical protein
MPVAPVCRVFVPASVVQDNAEGLDAASADDTFYVVGPAGRYEMPGYLVALDELDKRGVPLGVSWNVGMIAGLNFGEHVILLHHSEGLWELLIQHGKGLPETYMIRDASAPAGSQAAPSAAGASFR